MPDAVVKVQSGMDSLFMVCEYVAVIPLRSLKKVDASKSSGRSCSPIGDVSRYYNNKNVDTGELSYHRCRIHRMQYGENEMNGIVPHKQTMKFYGSSHFPLDSISLIVLY